MKINYMKINYMKINFDMYILTGRNMEVLVLLLWYDKIMNVTSVFIFEIIC